MDHITLKRGHLFSSLQKLMRNISFRGIYTARGSTVLPYKNARFSITTVYPQSSPGSSPTIRVGRRREPLFTAQPTIYENQIKILEEVDRFLLTHNMKMSALKNAVEYD